MISFLPSRETHQKVLDSNWGYFLTCGIGLLSTGLAIIVYSFATPFVFDVSPTFLGFMIIAASLFLFLDTFQFWWRLWIMFVIYINLSLLYLIIGLLFIFPNYPLGVVLMCFFAFLGVSRMIYGLVVPFDTKLAWFYNGVMNLIMALMLFFEWPFPATPHMLAIMVGMDLFIAGGIRITSAMIMSQIKQKKIS